jgi:ribonuclease P protein component
MLKKKNRIHLKNDFDRVFEHGNSFYNKILGIKFCKNNLSISRFGIIVSSKISKGAVKRNQIKRIIRDYLQENIDNIESSRDFVIITLPEIEKKDKFEIRKALFNTLQALKSFKNKTL